jgi:hypothetical protein
MFVYENDMGIMSDDTSEWHGWTYTIGVILELGWDILESLLFMDECIVYIGHSESMHSNLCNVIWIEN